MSRNRGEFNHPKFHWLQADLGDLDAMESFSFPLKAEDLNPTDRVVLLNNAGMLGDIKRVGDLEAKNIRQTMAVNLTAPIMLCNRFIHEYRSSSAQALILQVSTGAASSPYDAWSLYCASKSGLEMFSRVIDAEGAMQIKSVAPGIAATAMQEAIRESDEAHFSRKDKFIAFHEDGMLSDPHKVGEAYVHILEQPEQYPELIFRIPQLT